MEAQNTEKRDSEKQKKSKAGRAVAIAVIILLLLALIVCLIIIFTHRHTMTHYAYAEATCTAGGNAEYWYCAGCDGYFEDEEGENEVEFSGLILPAAGHEWMAASCDSPRRCNICGYSDGAALGHSWGDYEFSPSDCGSEGAILRVCTACGEVERIAVPVHGNAHNWGSIAVVQPSCVSAGRAVLTCADCGETVSSVIPATGAHHWDDGKITMPGCTGTGSIIHTCIDCGATETDVIPASGHVWISAGCTSPVTCAVCGATSGSALGHSWGDWTPAGDANHSRECTRCHSVEYEEHDFGGAEYGTCAVCDYVKTQPSSGGVISESGIEVLVEYMGQDYYGHSPYGYVNYTTNGNVDVSIPYTTAFSDMTFTSGTKTDIIISLYSDSLSTDAKLSTAILDGGEYGEFDDVYMTIQNDNGAVVRFYPFRFTLSLWSNEDRAFVEVAGCNDMTLTEMKAAIASNTVLNDTISAGEMLDITFRVTTEWYWEVDSANGEYLAIKGDDGQVYYFDDLNKGYLEAELAGDPGAHGTSPIKDTAGNTWTVLEGDSYEKTSIWNYYFVTAELSAA